MSMLNFIETPSPCTALCLEGVIKTKRVPWETHLVCSPTSSHTIFRLLFFPSTFSFSSKQKQHLLIIMIMTVQFLHKAHICVLSIVCGKMGRNGKRLLLWFIHTSTINQIMQHYQNQNNKQYILEILVLHFHYTKEKINV